jgi:DNA polymerase III delta prime subunit
LTKSALDASLANATIEVFGSERLAEWCNRHPAVAAHWAGRPDGLWTVDQWFGSDEHQVPWQATDVVKKEIEKIAKDLDFALGEVYHLHVQGPPGVGKTRFALELCRAADWESATVYVRQAGDLRLMELIDSAAVEPDLRLMIVADEVQLEQLLPLRSSIGRSKGRIRLITIGHSPTPDAVRIPSLPVKPLDRQAIGLILKGWHPSMSAEHVDFVASFAGGYIRLARLASDAVVRGTVVDVRGLLRRDEIRSFLDGMLGQGDRRALYVVAVLTRVGWIDACAEEGKAISAHFGLDWNDVRHQVDTFDRKHRIVPRGGRYRYVSPTPLGIHLAVEAWSTFPELLRTLPTQLPSEEAVTAYYDRLRSIASSPDARQYAREQLAFFFCIDDFVDARGVRLWSALVSADPDLAARNIRKALSSADVDDRARVIGDARRYAVNALVRLAWKSSSFDDAVLALALLAEAENESWANNASEEFKARFQILLSGTPVPYLRRLAVLDELLARQRPRLVTLVLQALALVGTWQNTRMVTEPLADELPEKEWMPATWDENSECVEAGIMKLTEITRSQVTGSRDLISVATGLSGLMLRGTPRVRRLLIEFYDAVRRAVPDAREPIRRAIADVILRERASGHTMPAEEARELEELHALYEDTGISARLQQFVGHVSWDRERQPDLKPIAAELLASPLILEEQWKWLTSGEASDAWRLGEALGDLDDENYLAVKLTNLEVGGSDLRVLAGYVGIKRRTLGDRWYENWMLSLFSRTPKSIVMIFEVLWRCGATEEIARLLARLLYAEEIRKTTVANLGNGRWDESLSTVGLEAILSAMVKSGHHETALAILARRLMLSPSEIGEWKSIALQLVTTPELIRSSESMISYYWSEVAGLLVRDHAGRIAEAILQTQADRGSGTWFVEHSYASGILDLCVTQDSLAVWEALKPRLASIPGVYLFVIGFPVGLVDRMPTSEVDQWIKEAPGERAAILARLAKMDIVCDESLISRIVSAYSDLEEVASAAFGAYSSGGWVGRASSHWMQRAEVLESVRVRSALPNLRRWAAEAASSLRKMAERDQQREEEQDLHDS